MQDDDTEVSQLNWSICFSQWRDSTGCSIAVGSCYRAIQDVAGTLQLKGSPVRSLQMPMADPRKGSMLNGEPFMPATDPTYWSTVQSVKPTKAMVSAPTSTAY